MMLMLRLDQELCSYAEKISQEVDPVISGGAGDHKTCVVPWLQG